MSKLGRSRRSPERRIEERKMRAGNILFQRELKQHMIEDAISKADPEQVEYLAGEVSETKPVDPTEALRTKINQSLHRK